MELEGGTTLHNFSASSSLLPTLPNTSITFLKKKKKFQGSVTSGYQGHVLPPKHFTHLFILGI
jgi:hypothetical protein